MPDVHKLFDPINPGDKDTFEFDFTLFMDVEGGEEIVTASWACTVRSGTDASAAGHLSGGATVSTDKMRTAQFVENFIPTNAGVTYILAATVITNKNNKKTLYGGLPCVAIT